MTQAFGVAPLIPLFLLACSIQPDPAEEDFGFQDARIEIEDGSPFRIIDDSHLIHRDGAAFDLLIESAVVANAPQVSFQSSEVSSGRVRRMHAPTGTLAISGIVEFLEANRGTVLVSSSQRSLWMTAHGRLVTNVPVEPISFSLKLQFEIHQDRKQQELEAKATISELAIALVNTQSPSGFWDPENVIPGSPEEFYAGGPTYRDGITGLSILALARAYPHVSNESERRKIIEACKKATSRLLEEQSEETGVFGYDFGIYSDFVTQAFVICGLAAWYSMDPSEDLASSIQRGVSWMGSAMEKGPGRWRDSNFEKGLVVGGVGSSLQSAGLGSLGTITSLIEQGSIPMTTPPESGRLPYSLSSKYPDHPVCIGLTDVHKFYDFDHGDSSAVFWMSAHFVLGKPYTKEMLQHSLSGSASGELPSRGRDLLSCALAAEYLIPKIPSDDPLRTEWAGRMKEEILEHDAWKIRVDSLGLVPAHCVYGDLAGDIVSTALVLLVASGVVEVVD